MRLLWLPALAAALLLGAVLTACDPGADVTYENKTDRAISIFDNSDLDARLEPGQKRTFTFIVYQGSRRFTAKDDAGNVLLEADYTWDDLKRLGWRIVVGP